MSASSTRALRAALPAFPLRPLATAGSSRLASTYTPSGMREVREIVRPRRPSSPNFWSTKPELHDAVAALESTLASAQKALRAQHIWPIPAEMPVLPAPRASFRSAGAVGISARGRADARELSSVLNQLNNVRHIARTAGQHDVAAKIDDAVSAYEKPARPVTFAERQAAGMIESGLDAYGRAFATGARKESSARVWVVPTPAAKAIVSPKTDAEAENTDAAAASPSSEAQAADADAPLPVPKAEILVNHLPLAMHFGKPADRENVLRPLRLTGMLGAYNVFALVRGGGTTGQSQAIALAIARAVRSLQEGAYKVLMNDNALYRDPRVVERKKTGRAKARKGYTWVKR